MYTQSYMTEYKIISTEVKMWNRFMFNLNMSYIIVWV